MTEDVIELSINDRVCRARKGELLIEVADREGIAIPRFCYHKKLAIAANCRMCLVEVEKSQKPLPACATPVMAGMKVYTASPKARAAQKATMEFLLINHPLDCPVCDQGGECELQDVAQGYGAGLSHYREAKRAVCNEDLGPLIATEMTRCIHCTRCVRFGSEIAGLRELGATGRSEFMRIGTFVAHTLAHELSANVIDLCPVGALTAKPSKDRYRPWELRAQPGLGLHDSLGSHLYWHTLGAEVMRVVPRACEAINEIWLSDRDRFAYTGLHSAERLHHPMIRRQGEWQRCDWDTALEATLEILRAEPAQSQAWLSPQQPLESLYLAQKLLRGMGIERLEHRLSQTDLRHPEHEAPYPSLGMALDDIAGLEQLLWLGPGPRQDQPLLHHRLRQAALHHDTQIWLLETYNTQPLHPLAAHHIVHPSGLVERLAGLTRALLDAQGVAYPAALAEVLGRAVLHKDDEAVLAVLCLGAPERRVALGSSGDPSMDSKPAEYNSALLILLSSQLTLHPDYSLLRALASVLAEHSHSAWGEVPSHANSAGAYLAGAVRHRQAGGAARPCASETAGWEAPAKRYFILDVEPERDTAYPALARQRLREARSVVALSAYPSQALWDHADVLLPIAVGPESSGTWVNAEGRWQSMAGAIPPPGEARPAWKVLRVLGTLAGLANFDYHSPQQLREELAALCPPPGPRPNPYLLLNATDTPYACPADTRRGLWRQSYRAPLGSDGMVRRAAPLQALPYGEAGVSVARLHPDEAKHHGIPASQTRIEVRQDGMVVDLTLQRDPGVPLGSIVLPLGVKATAALGPAYGLVDVR
ncbi:NADH-quinone oxidoreductase subunit NuoG [Thiorhodospira sibirica]|uniref:NADH-quinone oxidoreductase subunit NuoG n=1 Tax=Thiorhodospira sibirica TaxID=154347 RepID=UPI00022C5291|nr:NADH-quinone oxidoreductase subunit NuoG [Thiorhodospira sibirica]